MSRNTAWRNTASVSVSSHQDQALCTTMLLLRSYGPTAFLLKQEGDAQNFKVCLGYPHTCTCPVFTKEQELCKHICWILLRKFRLPREHEYSFQRGLVERQLLELLQGSHQAKAHRTDPETSPASGTPSQAVPGPEAGSVCRKAIQAQDVCPICQEELLQKKQPVSYCRFGCGNNVHISCMKVWADHQRLSDQQEVVKCPLCREDFSSLKLLHEQVKNAAQLFTAAEREKPNRHLGVLCCSCRVSPISGTCFNYCFFSRCSVCSHVYLCEDCVKKGCHSQHPLASRTTRRQKWIFVEDPASDPNRATFELQHDSFVSECLPNGVLERLPAVKVRSGSHLLKEGLQCRVCLQRFSPGQTVRTLPCHHKFHVDCVDQILLKSNSCPLDGFIIYSPLTWRTPDRKTSPKLSSALPSKQLDGNLQDLFVPGVALQIQSSKTPPAHGALHLEVLTDALTPLNTPQTQVTAAVRVTKNQNQTLVREQRARERQQMNPFASSSRQESDNTTTIRGTTIQPKKRDSNRFSSEPRLTGDLINNQQ